MTSPETRIIAPADDLARAAALVTAGMWIGIGTVFTTMWLLARWRRIRDQRMPDADGAP